MRTVSIVVTGVLLLAGCGTGAYVVGNNGELAWGIDDAMSRLYRGHPHEYLTELSGLHIQANKKDRAVIVQEYWTVLREIAQTEGAFPSAEVEWLRARLDADLRAALDQEVAAFPEEEKRKREAAQAEKADKAQKQQEQFEAGMRQLRQDTAAFLQQHSGKSLQSMTTIEVDELVGLWRDCQTRWLCSTKGLILDAVALNAIKRPDSLVDPFELMPPWMIEPSPDGSNIPRIDFLSLETFYSVFGKPNRVQTDPGEHIFPTFWFLYGCRDSTIRIKCFVIKQNEFRMAVILESQAL